MALLVSIRILEFSGNAIATAALSDNDNAEIVSIVIPFHDLISVITGSFIVGSTIHVSISRGDLKQGKISADSLKSAVIAALMIAGGATLVSMPFYYHANTFLDITLNDNDLVQTSAHKIRQLYNHFVPGAFLLNWASVTIMNGAEYEWSLLASNVFRLALLTGLSYGYIETANNSDERFDRFTTSFLISYLGPFAFNLWFILYHNRHQSSSLAAQIRASTINISLLFSSIWRQLKFGFGVFTAFLPPLIHQYLMVALLAPMVSDEVVASMQGRLMPMIILILMGNGVFTLALRQSATALSMVHGNSTDAFLQRIHDYILKLETTYLINNTVMGGIFTATMIGMTDIVCDAYDPGNHSLCDEGLTAILFTAATLMMNNDACEAILTGLNIARFKAITTPLFFVLAIVFGFGMIESGLGAAGIFGGFAIAMLLSTLSLVLHTHDRLPCRMNANIQEKLETHRDTEGARHRRATLERIEHHNDQPEQSMMTRTHDWAASIFGNNDLQTTNNGSASIEPDNLCVSVV